MTSLKFMCLCFSLIVMINNISNVFQWQERRSIDNPNQKSPGQPVLYLGQFSIGQAIRVQLKAPHTQNAVLDQLDATTGPSPGYTDNDPSNSNGPAGMSNTPGKSGLYYQPQNSNKYSLFVPYSSLTGTCIDKTSNNHFQGSSCFFDYEIKAKSKYLLLLTTGASFFNSFSFYYVDVYSYFSSTVLASVNNNKIHVLKVLEVLRNKVQKIVYFNQTKSSTIKLFPVNSDPYGNPLLSRKIEIYPIAYSSNGNQFLVYSPLNSVKSTYNPAMRTLSYTHTFTQGFYLIRTHINDQYIYNIKLYFSSDQYLCPYDSTYPDVHLNFQGCIPKAVSRYGFPCDNYDSITGRCKQCASGYKLQNYACQEIQNSYCPKRTYYRYGNCLPVNPLCGNFDFYTGQCLSCLDPANYNFINRQCIYKTVICTQRQYKKDNICLNVSQYCGFFDTNTGYCLTCISKLYYLSSYGVCTPLILDCPPGSYQDGTQCWNIPGDCVDYNRLYRKCNECILGYKVDTQGVCQRIKCPNRYIPSSYGQFCTKVSDECGVYDIVKGNCITCALVGYIPRGGTCVRIISQLYSCQSKYNLGYGINCGLNNVNCQIYDLQKQQCHKCIQGYFLNYNFLCVLLPICATDQYLFNNQCRNLPINCLTVTQLGHCTSCINQHYKIILNQCVFIKYCLQRQYLNINNQCVDVDPKCGEFNPTNGQCMSCMNGRYPQEGLCCDIGFRNVQGICQHQYALQLQSYQRYNYSNCRLKHPFLKICLICPQGFAVNYQIPFGCSQY